MPASVWILRNSQRGWTRNVSSLVIRSLGLNCWKCSAERPESDASRSLCRLLALERTGGPARARQAGGAKELAEKRATTEGRTAGHDWGLRVSWEGTPALKPRNTRMTRKTANASLCAHIRSSCHELQRISSKMGVRR